MNTRKTIRKILFITIWIAIGGGMLTLLVAAIGRQRKDLCKDYSISIKTAKGEELFLDAGDVLRLLKAATKGKIKGQPKAAFNLRQMEQLLEDNHWVKTAQLYFDNKDVLHVSVTEREPVARIFTAGGQSFYIDETGQRMQLSDKGSAKVPVFTGFPDKKRLAKKDSSLLHDVQEMAQFINNNPFWTAQVAQIDIDADCGPDCWEFDMTPVVGNHMVKLGTGADIEQKFRRLFIFYKQVLSKTGFDKYKTIDVRYSGQVVAGKSENPRVDEKQLRENVEKLLQQIKEVEQRTEEEQSANADPARANTPATDKPAALNMDTGPAEPRDDPGPIPAEKLRTESKSTHPAMTPGKSTKGNERPKAVMKKRGA